MSLVQVLDFANKPPSGFWNLLIDRMVLQKINSDIRNVESTNIHFRIYNN